MVLDPEFTRGTSIDIPGLKVLPGGGDSARGRPVAEQTAAVTRSKSSMPAGAGLEPTVTEKLLHSEVLFERPERLTDVRGWHGHIPFALWLIEQLAPRLFVELGTHKGDSYCAFCQAVQKLALPTRCYAVDTWAGDSQAGHYDEEVFADLRDHHDVRYGRFSRLVRSSFDAALEHFDASSIDLLHIDGLHTYDSVRHDFEAWRTRLSPNAIVLFHDVNVREEGFGVWRLWEELKTSHRTFTFLHSNGLGVLAAGNQYSPALERLLDAHEPEAQRIRSAFACMGDAVTARGDHARKEAMLREEVNRGERKHIELKALTAELTQQIQRAEKELEQERAERCALAEKLQRADEALLDEVGRASASKRTFVDLQRELDMHAGSLERARSMLEATERDREERAALVACLEARTLDLEVLRAQAASDAEAQRTVADRYKADASYLWRALTAAKADAECARQEARTNRSELAEARGSLSWRVTRPLRRLSSMAPSFRGVALAAYWAGTLQLHQKLRQRRMARQLVQTGLFDACFYRERYPDVAVSGLSPEVHYLTHGAAEGRDPNHLFSTSYYLAQNPDVAQAGINPLLHYAEHGAHEGRRAGPDFDGSVYLQQHPDVAAAGMNPLRHYLSHGILEGRTVVADRVAEPAQGFDLDAHVQRVRGPRKDDRAILIVDHRLPTPDLDSGSVRMFALVEILRGLGFSLTFVSDLDSAQPSYESALRALSVKVIYGLQSAEAHLLKNGHQYRFALLSRPSVGDRYLAVVRAHAIFADVIYDSVDLHWLRFRRAAELLGDVHAARAADDHRKLEEFSITCSDLVLAVTETEKRKILDEMPLARVAVVPNIHRCRPLPRPWRERRDLMFIGGYEHAPNVDAVVWFVTEVFPLITREIAGIRFHIVGSKPPESLKVLASESVELVGYVRDPEPYFEGARVFVAPLRYGAGMKGKIGQAMSLGLPVVTTSIGAEGMLLSHGTHALIADEPVRLAEEVVRLYTDETLWKHIRDRACSHIDSNFSDAAVSDVVREIFLPLADGGRAAFRSNAT